MAFKAGSIYGEAVLDTKKWDGGIKRITAGAGIAVAAIGAAFVAAMAKAIKTAYEFEKAMSNVATVVDTSVISTKYLTRQLLLVDPALGDTTKLAKGLYQAFSAGAKSTKEAMKITVTAAKFGTAALTDTNTAVDILTTAINAYGREAMDAEKASDIFFTTIKEGKITGEELAGTIGQSIPLFASAGIELEELTSGMAAMTKQGVSANETTTQLNAIVNAFLKPSEAMAAGLKDIGYESGSAFLKAEGLSGALKFMEEVTRGDAAEIAKLTPNIRAMRGIMALTGEGGKEFNDVLKEMEGAAGATTIAFDKQEKTLATYSSAMNKLEIVLGTAATKGMKPVAQWLTTIITNTTTAIIKMQELQAIFAGEVGTELDVAREKLEALIESRKKLTEVGTQGQMRGAVLTQLEIDITDKAIEAQKRHINQLALVEAEKARGAAADAAAAAEAAEKAREQAAAAEAALAQLEALTAAYGATPEGIRAATQATLEYWQAAYHGGLRGIEIDTVIIDLKRQLAEETKKAADAELNIAGELIDTKDAIATRWANREKELRDAAVEYYKKADEEIAEAAEIAAAERIRIEEEVAEELKKSREDWANAAISIASYMTDSISSITSMYHQNELDQLTLSTQNDLAALQLKFDNGLISEEEYETKKAEIEKTARDKKNKIEEDAFNAKKATDIAGVWIDAASAIMGWWATAPMLGPIAGPIFAGIMTAVTLGFAGVQTALIASQTFVPSKQEGGLAGGMTRVNEAGGEIIQLPDQSLVIPHDISRQIAASAGGPSTIIHVSFAGAQISDNMSLDRVTNHVIRKIGKQMRLAG